MQVAEGVFAAVTSVDELPDKIRVQISPKAAGPVSFTLLIIRLYKDNTSLIKCTSLRTGPQGLVDPYKADPTRVAKSIL